MKLGQTKSFRMFHNHYRRVRNINTLQVDWTSGPATGATAGSLRLSVDGVSRPLQTGNTSTLRVDTARLGVIAGFTTTSAGTAYFDSFVSTRNTLP